MYFPLAVSQFTGAAALTRYMNSWTYIDIQLLYLCYFLKKAVWFYNETDFDYKRLGFMPAAFSKQEILGTILAHWENLAIPKH